MLHELQQTIGYTFAQPELLRQAVTHSSYTNEHRSPRTCCNERLEFLGDAVLELSSSECLYERYPEQPEGELTKLRASIVCEPTLAQCARAISPGGLPAAWQGRGRNRRTRARFHLTSMLWSL